jgi:hypothetical protein
MKRTMNRFIGLLITIVLALGCAFIINAFTSHAVAKPTAGNSNHAFAVGGFLASDLTHVAFAAQINPQDSTKFAGHVVLEEATGATISGPVICVSVNCTINNGNATVVWRVQRTEDQNYPVGTCMSFQVFDSGEPAPPASPDFFNNRYADSNCGEDFISNFQPIIKGNIVVKGPATCSSTPNGCPNQ